MQIRRIGRTVFAVGALGMPLLLGSCAVGSDAAPIPSPESTLGLGAATLEFPTNNTDVKQCARLRGRANLPPDRTLIIGVRNLDNRSPERYFGAIDRWDYPLELRTWEGSQWFGSKDTSVGQRYRVELLTMDVEDVKKAVQLARSESGGWHSPDNPPGAEVKSHITMKRVAGPGPAACY